MADSPHIQRLKEQDQAGAIFAPTAAGILEWARTTKPTPAKQDVIDHARTLIDEGLLSEADRAKLVRSGYPELDD